MNEELLKKRRMAKKRKPAFTRQECHKKKRVKMNWRKPRGIDSKMRLGFRGRKKLVSPGYGSPKIVKNLNKDGLKEVIVENVADLKKIEDGCVGVIASKVGAKKKISVLKESQKQGLKISNYDESFIKKFEEKLKTKKEKSMKKEEKKGKKETPDKKTEEKKEEKSGEEKKREKDKILTKKGAM